MGNSVGRRVLPESAGRGIDLSADGAPVVKAVGITVDWSTVAAVGTKTVEPDNIVIEAGQKYLRCGQILNRITATGLYGPFDPAAADGRQLTGAAARGKSVMVRRTILEDEDNSNHPRGVMEGGLVVKARLRAHATTASLANGPLYADAEAMFPQMTYAEDV